MSAVVNSYLPGHFPKYRKITINSYNNEVQIIKGISI